MRASSRAPPRPASERTTRRRATTCTSTRRSCRGTAGRLAAPRPGKRIVEPGEGEDGGESPLARHDPGDGQLAAARVGGGGRAEIAADAPGRAHLPGPHADSRPGGEQRAVQPEGARTARIRPCLGGAARCPLRTSAVTDDAPPPRRHRRRVAGAPGDPLERRDQREGLRRRSNASYAEDSQRHLAPPKGSMQMAEFDGKFDTEMRGAPAAVTSALRTALREEGTFLDPKIVNLTTGKKSINQTSIEPHPSGPGGATVPTKRGTGLSGDKGYDERSPGRTSSTPRTRSMLPYLPDPMAIGIAIVGYDVTGAEVLSHTEQFPGTWPKLAPFRIRLSELPGPEPPAPPTPPTIKFTGGILEIGLAKAGVVRAQLSSIFPRGRLKDFAIWDWTDEQDRTPDLEAAALGGRHWMLTPYRWLTLTHAVQQPLLVPDMTKVTVSRKLGQTFAELRRSDPQPRPEHRPTRRVRALDGGRGPDRRSAADDGPDRQRRRARRAGVRLRHWADRGPGGRDRATIGTQQRASRHEFGDTKYRRIVYHSVATTRFREYLPPAIAADPGRSSGRGLDGRGGSLATAARAGRPQLREARHPRTSSRRCRPSAGSATTRARSGPTSGAARPSACGCAARGSRPATASSSGSCSSRRSGWRRAGSRRSP